MTKRARFFIYAPPLKGVRQSRRKEPNPPFGGAERWQWSVYYYWWEYLRRHDGYRATCERGGKGRYAKLYADFGDVHSGDFWNWWTAHEHLFCEPSPRLVQVVCPTDKAPAGTLLLAIPVENKATLSLKQVKALLADSVGKPKTKPESRALYPVCTKPVLSTLHQHLVVWDAKRANPNLSDAEIADLIALPINHKVDGETLATLRARDLPTRQLEAALRRRKQLAIQRHLRIAKQYIDNVALGKFPLRSYR
jgi:hypothetical protein